MSECIFCQIVAGTIPSKPVYEDTDFIAIPDIHPRAPVHLLVIPKKHVADFMDADEKMVQKLMAAVKHIIREQKIMNYRFVANGGGAAFIDHLHMHILGSIAKDRDV